MDQTNKQCPLATSQDYMTIWTAQELFCICRSSAPELKWQRKHDAMFRTFVENEMLLSLVIPILLNNHYLLEAYTTQVQNVNLLFPLEQMLA